MNIFHLPQLSKKVSCGSIAEVNSGEKVGLCFSSRRKSDINLNKNKKEEQKTLVKEAERHSMKPFESRKSTLKRISNNPVTLVKQQRVSKYKKKSPRMPKSNKIKNIEKSSNSSKLATYYCTILFLLKKFKECNSSIVEWVEHLFKENDTLGVSNLLKLLACIKIYEKDFYSSLIIMDHLSHLFKLVECEIGSAVTGYIVGHIKCIGNQNAMAKEKFKNSLQSYKYLGHVFGQYYCLMNLVKLETKLKNKASAASYNAMMKEVNKKKKGKHYFQSTSKNGRFVIRQDLDQHLNLLIEPCFKTKIVGERRTNVSIQRERRQLKKLREAYKVVTAIPEFYFDKPGKDVLKLKSKSVSQSLSTNTLVGSSKSPNHSKSRVTSKSGTSDMSDNSRTPRSKKSYKVKKRRKGRVNRKKVGKDSSKSPKFGKRDVKE